MSAPDLLDKVTEQKVPGTLKCQQCGKAFPPRQGNGGKRQKFCSAKCRQQSRNAQRVSDPNASIIPNASPPTRQRSNPNASNVPPRQPSPLDGGPDSSGDVDEFDWNDDRLVTLPAQQQIAIYHNPKGSLVIRQMRDPLWQQDDPFVCISASNIEEFLDQLTDVCGIPSFPARGRDGKP
jgi:hypothetical protein